MSTNEQFKMKMLWHHAYWDNPISGIGEHNGKKVWFQMEHDGIVGPDEKDYTQEIKDIIKNYQYDENVENCEDGADDDCIASTTDYKIYYYPEYSYRENYETKTVEAYFAVRYKLSYKMYKLPQDVQDKIERDFSEFCRLRDNGNWHDPYKFKAHSSDMTKEYQEFYERYKNDPTCLRIPKQNLEKYECLGIVKYDEIEWFNRLK